MRDVDIPNWLKELPLAPVFYPTDTEFADPIAYISKIEKEASAFGICKVIPPLPKPSKKYVISNLNKSLLKSPELGSDVKLNNVVKDGEVRAVFTTRHQELGHNSGKRTKEAGAGSGSGSGSGHPHPPVVNKQVWQSGEIYTLDQFESKSKTFAKSQLSMIKDVSPMAIESLFWKAACEKPIYIEYANDVPGSGFGEPVGPARFLHKHRRRRRRTFNRGNQLSSAMNEQPENRTNNCEPIDCSPSSSVDMLKKDTSLVNDNMSDSVNEIEGSSGWKLSNCPWNLQVIARSPGSLTRFMPDDIPGVTSPMVYIGMLFSWFAWHVEDHELHSLNFLHIGSPKTWYAIPGDYAFTFEEVIRSKAYGEGIDRLAALTLLGEKTTLLSPEIVVASGIPCCRLVQNPGEFVVTFPRAYHIGFSHGFNCGEAANFATPKWLSVAKEAAVRRAAMNFLPMLSHQQLLYILTMSFIPRVPRSLLPGIRSSRSKNRQKEERELLVKKAFIKDILNENKLLHYILQKKSSYRAVLWDIESLSPSVIKERDFTKIENVHVENDSNSVVHIEDDDLSSDFQIDSGSLPCVACGVLGYPFMSVVQPLAKVVMDDVPVTGHGLVQAHRIETELVDADKGWSMCKGYLRPRIFCLEHVSKIEELLDSMGGAKLLILCHADFQKIKLQASTVAEQIGSPFRYNEVQVDDLTRDDLDLINLAIENEQEDESVEDWTLKLGVNIRQTMKLGPKLLADNIHSALTMNALVADPTPELSDGLLATVLKWHASKTRSHRKSNHSVNKLSKLVSVEQDLDVQEPKKEGPLIQYSRRIFRSKLHGQLTDLSKNGNKDGIRVSSDLSSVEKLDFQQVVEESCAAIIENYGKNENDGEETVTDSNVRVAKGEISDVNDESTLVSNSTSGSKRKREVVSLQTEDKSTFNGFIKSPCEGLRPRAGKDSHKEDSNFINTKTRPENPPKKSKVPNVTEESTKKNEGGPHKCDREGCKMSFTTKTELTLHRKNICPHEGCGKKFSSHRYAVLHLRVHEDNRPLKCTWKGCKMTFKWAWALTEHMRVHTGERPYKCKVEGCGLTFRFVSDFSRHRRKTGHNVNVVKS